MDCNLSLTTPCSVHSLALNNHAVTTSTLLGAPVGSVWHLSCEVQRSGDKGCSGPTYLMPLTSAWCCSKVSDINMQHPEMLAFRASLVNVRRWRAVRML